MPGFRAFVKDTRREVGVCENQKETTMTTVYHQNITCAICGTEFEYTGIASTNAFGPTDLDTQPPEMERSTIDAWVQRCPQCGY